MHLCIVLSTIDVYSEIAHKINQLLAGSYHMQLLFA